MEEFNNTIQINIANYIHHSHLMGTQLTFQMKKLMNYRYNYGFNLANQFEDSNLIFVMEIQFGDSNYCVHDHFA